MEGKPNYRDLKGRDWRLRRLEIMEQDIGEKGYGEREGERQTNQQISRERRAEREL